MASALREQQQATARLLPAVRCFCFRVALLKQCLARSVRSTQWAQGNPKWGNQAARASSATASAQGELRARWREPQEKRHLGGSPGADSNLLTLGIVSNGDLLPFSPPIRFWTLGAEFPSTRQRQADLISPGADFANLLLLHS